MESIIKYLFVLGLVGCVQNPVRVITVVSEIPDASEVKEEPDKITSDADLDQVIDETIIESRFSIGQKTELDNLRAELKQKLQINAVINLKLRGQLFRELLSTGYSPLEIQLIQEMLQRNSFERNSLITQSIEITNVITGRTEITTAAEHLRRETFIVY